MEEKKSPVKQFFAHWKTPKEGNYVSNSEFVSWCAASMGLGGWKGMLDLLTLNAGTATICALIFQIKVMDVFALGIIGLVVNYITLPLGPYIMDNMGRFPKKVNLALLLGGGGVLLLAGVLWLLPSPTFFESLLPDFLKHIALRLAVFVLIAGLMVLILRVFGKKYGKFKPFMIFYGPLLLGLITLMVNIPYRDMSYSRLLLAVDLITMLIGGAVLPSTATQGSNILVGVYDVYNNVDRMQGRMSPNSQERTRIMSIAPIFNGLLRQIFGILFPIIAGMAFFGGVENIRTFRYILPVYGAVCLLQSLMVLRAQERVVQERGHVARVKFSKTLREVFSNKYQWVKSIADVLSALPNIHEGMIIWLFIYATRMPWAYGLAASLYKLPTSSTGQLMAPFFTKRFSSRQSMFFQRLLIALLTLGLLPFLGGAQIGVWQIVMLLIFCSLKNFFTSCSDVIGKSIMADIWDYQQWKSGERLEASMGFFTYLTGPLGALVGYIMPFVINRAGFFGDMDVLYDTAVFQRVVTAQVLVFTVLTALSALPWLFYDLTPEKMERIGKDLKERAQQAKPQAQIEGGVTV